MKKDMLTVRDVDDEILGMFKAKAAERRMKMGEALTDAMQIWINIKEHPKKDSMLFAKAKPFGWGRYTKRTSTEVDHILYDNAGH